MGFEEGVDPVDGWSAPGQALVLFATRLLPLSAQIMSAAFSAIMMSAHLCTPDVVVSMIRFLSGRRGMLLEGVRHSQEMYFEETRSPASRAAAPAPPAATRPPRH